MTARLVVRAVGWARADEVWDRFVRPGRWQEWSPQIRRVDSDAEVIVAGAAGRVCGPAGASASFIVVDVDPQARTWSWRVRAGRLRLHIDHEVAVTRDGRTVAQVVLSGPWLAIACYSLPARLALHRLVRS